METRTLGEQMDAMDEAGCSSREKQRAAMMHTTRPFGLALACAYLGRTSPEAVDGVRFMIEYEGARLRARMAEEQQAAEAEQFAQEEKQAEAERGRNLWKGMKGLRRAA